MAGESGIIGKVGVTFQAMQHDKTLQNNRNNTTTHSCVLVAWLVPTGSFHRNSQNTMYFV